MSSYSEDDGRLRSRDEHGNRGGVTDMRPSEYRGTPPVVGQRIEVVDLDGTKHPELAGKVGVISLIRKSDNIPVIEVDGLTIKASDLYWRRL